MSELNGNLALITDGNSGIGLATAKQSAAEGAYVYIAGRRQEELDSAATAIEKNVTAVRDLKAAVACVELCREIGKFGCASTFHKTRSHAGRPGPCIIIGERAEEALRNAHGLDTLSASRSAPV